MKKQDSDAAIRALTLIGIVSQLSDASLTRRLEDGLSLAGRGLVDTTRLASSPPDIWQDVAATNADEIAVALDTFIALLQELRGDLAEGDRLAEVFVGAARWREKLATITNTKGKAEP